MIETLASKSVPYLIAFALALALTLVLTPLVRTLNKRLGMVDKPDARRINKVPIPRGGGLALVAGVYVSYSAFILVTGRAPLIGDGLGPAVFWKMTALGVAIAALGYADDKFSLNPRVKLAGQLVVAALVWAWTGLGFHRLWPGLHPLIDAPLTVFWVVGAINAFNLIDGLDGLASGLALIATLGMSGSLIIGGDPGQALCYFAFAGGLVGFLRYNYNPASVFLGDSGSMFIGYTLATLALASQQPDSFLVSLGVPLLAMGVPIFDTSLAILRRSIRHGLRKRNGREAGNGEVMTADTDHLHHRILRAAGLNQRRAAWALYALAAFLVLVGLGGMTLKSKAGGLWLFAVAAIAVVVFKDISRIELFDAGRLLNAVARDRGVRTRRRLARLNVPVYVAADLLALTAVFFCSAWVARLPVDRNVLRYIYPLHIVSTFCCLAFFNAYRTVWARAMLSNYMRLLLAAFFGATLAAFVTYYAPVRPAGHLKALMLLYASFSFLALTLLRTVRSVVRDLFYALDCARLVARKDVSRVLVYGCGLRYRSFRRELVRTTAANDRIIVGLLDDDILLRGQYIGGIQVLGTLAQAPEIINAVNADAVVIACEVTPAWLRVIDETLRPTGVRITHFTFSEKELPPPPVSGNEP